MIREDTILPAGCSPECGGCADGWCTEESSISRKQSRAARALTRWEDRLGALLSVSGEKRFGYRGRTALSARWTPGEGWRFGMEGVRAQGAIKMRFLRPRPFVSLLGCPVHSPGVRRMLNLLAASLPPDEPEGSFPLAFVSISGAQCTLIFKVKEDPGDEWFFSSRGGMPPCRKPCLPPVPRESGSTCILPPECGSLQREGGGSRGENRDRLTAGDSSTAPHPFPSLFPNCTDTLSTPPENISVPVPVMPYSTSTAEPGRAWPYGPLQGLLSWE